MKHIWFASALISFLFVISGSVNAQDESVIDYPDGSRFEGQVGNGQPNGAGVMRYSNGDVYQGQFINSRLQGPAILIKPDGSIFLGEFEDHNLVGEWRPVGRGAQDQQQQQQRLESNSFSDCKEIYRQDIWLGEMILKTNQVYGEQIRRNASDAVSAWASGTANATSNNAGQAMQQGGQASRPYNIRNEQLAVERDYKTAELQYERQVLKAANPHCKLL